MRDYKKLKGLNPKKTPVGPLAQYCAAADIADEEIKEQMEQVRESVGAFLTLPLLSETEIDWSLSVSDYIYVGLEGAENPALRDAAHTAAEGVMREAFRFLLREITKKLFSLNLRAGFGRPGELADHLRKDLKSEVAAPLEVFLPPQFWQMDLAGLKARYADTAAYILSERAHYEEDRAKAKADREARLKAQAEEIPYEGEMGAYISREEPAALQALRARYSAEEIALLQLAGKIRLSSALKKEYFLATEPKLDRGRYRMDFVPEYSCGIDKAQARTLAAAYEQEIRADRDAALEDTKAKNKERNKRKKRNAAIRSAIVNSIPDNYIDLFPLARSMERHFVLHIGPTNSGKTHDAIEALKAAESGIYLGPLRLLAFEQYEALNAAGCPCSLVTGEERIEDPWAHHQASTIEMLDPRAEYEVAVIDEAQMIGDPDRGGAWTAAILGVCAREIHVCAAPIAKGLLIRLIKDCGDSYSVVQHHRMTPLTVEKEAFNLDDSVTNGDALIVFSKKSVHGVASYLQKKGLKCSVVYGALPYDVRREQARLFAGGETDVVVATDAIGMGMNLPIRRVVFLEMNKFDGISVRPLETEEIKQIAGRAGRFGIYPEGFVSSVEEREKIRAALNGRSETVKCAVIDFPESLLGVDAPLSEIIERWSQIEIKPGYERADPARMLRLCRMIESFSDDKRFLYDCISMTFDEEDQDLISRWRVMCAREAVGEMYDVEAALPKIRDIEDSENMNDLEQDFKLCDLLFGYCEKFDHTELRGEIMHRKNRISERMTKILARQALSGKKCSRCGRAMPWNAPYGICERCFKRRRWEGKA